jgi:hypothetical protein
MPAPYCKADDAHLWIVLSDKRIQAWQAFSKHMREESAALILLADPQ